MSQIQDRPQVVIDVSSLQAQQVTSANEFFIEIKKCFVKCYKVETSTIMPNLISIRFKEEETLESTSWRRPSCFKTKGTNSIIKNKDNFI